ncbi:anaerobic ribonucleoside-triphosphate reductase activating protein [Metabacillus halosaccharovorans]|uniref:anaerobic ribonucleoside-triphosphate reductase activating protein n=1 Tax=Metabacillus halosaccharovorans TaxID=930124 RepID=UPI002041EAEE|nr:anaerobic ribonucleoside-triphosphate reductase activating protein [Metabacillus halosaccharovorans]MCM3443104.1 anaerobic ribonucleoside-triphosphate reductase activating protein [Metabacillus halosaccharovorans]
MKLNLHRYEPYTKVEGPGLRACIWVQGCPIGCDGCFNKATWDSKGGKWVDIDSLADKIIKDINHTEEQVEGITFLGGEPFQQAEALAYLGKRLKKEGLSIMTFSGYYYESILKANRKDWQDLLSVTDLLVDGPYVKEKHDLSRPWIGSSNQSYRFLTNRYAHLKETLLTYPNKLEVHIQPDGKVLINGMIRDIDLDELKRSLSI